MPSFRLLLVAAGALVLVGALVAVGWLWSDVQERRVTAAYAAVLTAAQTAATAEARQSAAQRLEAVLSQHPTGTLAAQAAYELANLRYAARDHARARSAFEVAISRSPAGTLRTLSRAGLGYSWEAERDYARAADAFRAGLAELSAGAFLHAELLADLARVQELGGRRDEALETWRRLLREAPASGRAEEARQRLAALGVSP